jgi:heterodisulfide reductase subunit A
MPKRIGVFVCWCGANIASSVDVNKVVEEIKKVPDVVFATNYMYMCSDPGQQLVKEHIVEDNLNGVVVCSCSPRMHENTFRKAAQSVGLNPFLVEIANIREQCSWVHQGNKPVATAKAINIIKGVIEKVRRNIELVPNEISLNKRTLVIGGGISGIMASLDLAEAGYEVVLVEKEQSIGGKLLQIYKTVPYLKPADDYILSRAEQILNNKNISLYTYSEISNLDGYVGNFEVTIKNKASYVDSNKCNNCNKCLEVCPVSVPDEFNGGLSNRKAIHYLSEKALPKRLIIDKENCLYFKDGSCSKCVDVCEKKAIDFNMEDKEVKEIVGAIVIATGYKLYSTDNFKEYGGGQLKDVIDSLTFERMLDPEGPTKGKIIKPSNGKEAKSVLWVKCAGSRDPEFHKPYCSRVCCIYTAKQAKIYKQRVTDGKAFISYMDVRTDCKGFEEFYHDTTENERVVYIRGRVSKIYQNGDKLVVYTADTISGESLALDVDLVVLANAIIPTEGVEELAKKLRATIDEYGFFSETHIKLYPVESSTKGVYLSGCAQSPKDITDSVSQALASTGKIMTLFANDKLSQDPLIAMVDPLVCSGCGICVEICPYGARQLNPITKISDVNKALCQGCGACIAACPNKACELINQTSIQTIRMINAYQEPDIELVLENE